MRIIVRMAKMNFHVDMDSFEELYNADLAAKQANTTIGRFFYVAWNREGYAFYQVVEEIDADHFRVKHADVGTETLPALEENDGKMLKEHVHHELNFREDHFLFTRLMQHKFSNNPKVTLVFEPGVSQDLKPQMKFSGAFSPI